MSGALFADSGDGVGCERLEQGFKLRRRQARTVVANRHLDLAAKTARLNLHRAAGVAAAHRARDHIGEDAHQAFGIRHRGQPGLRLGQGQRHLGRLGILQQGQAGAVRQQQGIDALKPARRRPFGLGQGAQALHQRQQARRRFADAFGRLPLAMTERLAPCVQPQQIRKAQHALQRRAHLATDDADQIGMATTALKGLFFSTQARRIGLRQRGLELGDAATGAFQLAVMKTLDRADASMRSERQPDPGDACRQTESDYKDE